MSENNAVRQRGGESRATDGRTKDGQTKGGQTRDTRTQQERTDAALLPPVEVIEDAGGITLYADLPGVPKENLHLQLEADTLTIEGEVALSLPDGMEAVHAEVSLPRYRRVFTLSKELDAGKVGAELSNGVLTLRIPKAEHAQPRRIEIKVS
jgi:HSP20 family protein